MDLETYAKQTKAPKQNLMDRYAEIAAQVGTSTIHLHNIARRHKLPGRDMIIKILEVCPGVTFAELVGMADSHYEKASGQEATQK
ncbi:MAG: hypothetical protein RBR16_13870 [Syntrophus sp. (in: bacteria)]|nr:hypothetical protein [Syntrophus sp. (in: bacteria)]